MRGRYASFLPAEAIARITGTVTPLGSPKNNGPELLEAIAASAVGPA
jgi:hypothetical protein